MPSTGEASVQGRLFVKLMCPHLSLQDLEGGGKELGHLPKVGDLPSLSGVEAFKELWPIETSPEVLALAC